MNENERDTHFQEAAKQLYQKLSDLNAGYETIISEDLNEKEQEVQLRLISQFLYDFTEHTLSYAMDDIEIIPEDIPDFTKRTD